MKRPITIDGVKFASIVEAARALKIPTKTLRTRLHRGRKGRRLIGKDVRIMNPVTVGRKKFAALKQAARYFGVHPNTARDRLRKGWTPLETFVTMDRIRSDECKGIVYLIWNDKNKKVYVGLTTQPLMWRFNEHLSAHRYPYIPMKLYDAMRRIGSKYFHIKVLARTCSLKSLREMEKKYIIKFDAVRNGYNSF